MPSLTLRNIPSELLERLRRDAEQHRRSLNSEVLTRLEHSVGAVCVDPQAFLARVARLPERADLPALTDALLAQAEHEGRP